MRLIPIKQLQVQITTRFVGKTLKKLPREAKPEGAGKIL